MSDRKKMVEKRVFDQFSVKGDLLDLSNILADRVDEIDVIINDLALRRFKDTAEGVWLEDIGEKVGIFSRPSVNLPPGEMFTYRSLSEPAINPALGYGTIGDPNIGGKYRSVYGNPTDVLVDDVKLLATIDMKIAANHSGAAVPDIYDYILNGFGAKSIITEVVGQTNVELLNEAPYLDDFQRALLVLFAPVQQGTRLRIINWQIQP